MIGSHESQVTYESYATKKKKNLEERKENDNGKKAFKFEILQNYRKKDPKYNASNPHFWVFNGGVEGWGDLKLEHCQFFLDFSITKELSWKQKTITILNYVKFAENISVAFLLQD